MDDNDLSIARQTWMAGLKSLVPVIAMLMIHTVHVSDPGSWTLPGVLPRTFKGLAGIFTYPLVHGSWEHLFNNAVPLVILGAILWFFYRKVAFRVYVGIWLISGIWLWAAARPAYHIGASGLVYGLAAFIAASGIMKRYYRLLALTLLVVFLYGGMIWYMFPIDTGISWEGHLFGALSGVVLAWYFRKEGPVKKRYEWEDEPDDDTKWDASAPLSEQMPYNDPNATPFSYSFKPEKEQNALDIDE